MENSTSRKMRGFILEECWLAGVIEADGCFAETKRNFKPKDTRWNYTYLVPEFGMNMYDEAVMKRIGKQLNVKVREYKDDKGFKHWQITEWGKSAVEIGERILECMTPNGKRYKQVKRLINKYKLRNRYSIRIKRTMKEQWHSKR